MGRCPAPLRGKVRVLGEDSIETRIAHRDTDFLSQEVDIMILQQHVGSGVTPNGRLSVFDIPRYLT